MATSTATPSSETNPGGIAVSSKKTLINTGIGNALEWYDWSIYATFSIYFAREIFNPSDPVASILGAMAIFAVGFIFRPIGGLFFGWMADRVGRKAVLLTTVGGIALGALMIGVTPTFETAGVFAAIMLLAARLIQGLAYGGEMPTAQTYLAEMAPPERRGLWSSMIYVSGTIGACLGIFMGVIMNLFLSPEEMSEWGWRVPFFIGALGGLWALVGRSQLHESETFKSNKAKRPSIWPEFRRNWKSAFRVIGLTIGGTVCYYVWSVSAVQQAVVVHGMPQATALNASLLANVVLIISLPFWGKFSDRFGRRPALIIGNVVPLLLFFPMNAMVGQTFVSLFFPAALILLFMGATLANTPAVFAELFPTSVRTVGVAFPYAVAVAIFGGTAPYLQNWISTQYSVSAFSVYVCLLLLVSSVVAFFLPETKGKDLRL